MTLDVPPEDEATSTSTSTSPAAVSTSDAAELWAAVIELLEAPPDEREVAAATSPDGVPVDTVLDIMDLYFVIPEAVDLSSNARYDEQADGTIAIADCADTAGPTGLGPTTAGFTATAVPGDDGMAIVDLRPVLYCAPRGDGEAALEAYDRYAASRTDFLDDPRPDHPWLTENQTEAAMAASVAYYEEVVEPGGLDGLRFNFAPTERHVEIVGYEPGRLVVRECIHGDETYGIFGSDGDRVDDLIEPWQEEFVARLVKVGDEWLFDEGVSRTGGPCSLERSEFGYQLL